MSQLNTVKISDLGKVITGKTPSTTHPEYFGGDYPFITPLDLSNDARAINTERTLSEEGSNRQKNLLLPSGSICFVCIGATIGKICMTNSSSFTNQQINSIIPDTKKYNNNFIYYLLKTKAEKVKSLAGGAATPIVSKTVFSSIEVDVPALPTQQKIASILSAYDDLIENNLKRIKILEEMAQMIYREWFVNFRFPGHEKVNVVKSELGMIPEGWETKNLGDVCNVVMGQSPKSEYYNTEGNGLPFHQGVKDFGSRFPTHKTYCMVESRIAEQGDILISVRAPVGRINLAIEKLIIGRGLSAIRHKHGLQSFMLYQMKHIF